MAGGTPIAGWFKSEHPSKMDYDWGHPRDLGNPHFMGFPTFMDFSRIFFITIFMGPWDKICTEKHPENIPSKI